MLPPNNQPEGLLFVILHDMFATHIIVTEWYVNLATVA